MVDRDRVFEAQVLHLLGRLDARRSEGRLQELARMFGRLEAPAAVDDADSEPVAKERPVAVAPGHVALALVRQQTPHVVAAVVVDDEQPAAGAQQRARFSEEPRSGSGHLRPRHDDGVGSADPARELLRRGVAQGEFEGDHSRAHLLELAGAESIAAIEDDHVAIDDGPERLESREQLFFRVHDPEERLLQCGRGKHDRQVGHRAS